MDALNTVFNFIHSLILNGGYLLSWLTTPFDFKVFSISPLALLGIQGLITYITVAVAKWIIN